ELLVDAELGLDLLGLVMDQGAELPLVLSRSAADDEDGDPLGERAGDRVHHVVAAGAVGDADDADPARGAGAAVGREPHAGLVRQGDDVQPMPPPKPHEQPEDQVARDAEEMGDADPPQVGDQEVAERHRRPHPSAPPNGVSYAKNFSTFPEATVTVWSS